jgi:hypothetical protein
MDLYIGNEVKYRLLCTIQDVKPQKMDARTVGLNIYCESLSPWAYSPMQTVTKSIAGGSTIEINNESDDMYSFVYPKITYNSTNGHPLIITNTNIDETTEVNNVGVNEIITLNSNQIITSDKPNRIFGSAFNFVWPRFKSGINNLNISAMGDITFEYCFPIKMGDCAADINIVSDPICSEDGTIQVDTLPWERISGTPNTLSGYGISDAYTKKEIDSMLENFVSDDVYTKSEIDEKFASIDVNIDTYTKAEIDEKLNNITASGVDISEEELSTMLDDVLGE